MRIRFAPVICLAAALGALWLPASAAGAPAPTWTLNTTALPSNYTPGEEPELLVAATNIGGAPTSGTSVLRATFPAPLTPTKIQLQHSSVDPDAVDCTIAGQEVSCETSEPIASSKIFSALIVVAVASDGEGSPPIPTSISGGGAGEAALTVSPPIQSEFVPFAISEPGLRSPLTEADGSAATLAGSHPFQQSLSFGFPSLSAEGGELTNDGHPHEIKLDLPPGLIGNPAVSPVLCTEAQLTAGACPPASQIGIFNLTTAGAGKGFAAPGVAPLYNMVPPPGTPAELGFNVEGIGIFVHIFTAVRTDGDYGIEVRSPDVLALGTEPIFNVLTQIWGDASDPSHPVKCNEVTPALCPQPPRSDAFWTLPTHCSETPERTSVRADSWEQRGTFVESSYDSADLAGSPVSLGGCGGLAFEPTIEARPTTDLADSPSGLQVHLHLPTDTALGHRSTAQLRDATVTLPPGMAVNPSQADGLAACDTQQIGMLTAIGASPPHFSRLPADCPQASRLGKVEVKTPLLAEYDAEHKIVNDPETGLPVPRPLHGSVFLAKPFENPFHSLLALYLTVEDPRTGTFAKLAGRVEPDPASGQLTTVFEENPQLPLEDIDLELFGGARGSLITPPTCGTHPTTTTFVPWSAPEGVPVHPGDSFQITKAPGGGNCPSSESGLSAAPGFLAGTLTRQAGSYSPFVLKVSREDGTQRLGRIDTTLPPGLTGKLAGIPACPEAQIAHAQARSNPEEGRLERESPSCPLASELGTLTVGAGAGPTPFHTQGHAYLAGPYKGAPVSLVAIVPAIAGPFDLGTVVSRVALQVDPDTAQIHAVSDPLPTILEGIPLDVRSVALKMDRPQFVLNPTSCDPMTISGAISSPLGQAIAVSTPFQVGGCQALPFKPRLALRLKGSVKRSSHPRLIANVKAKPGEANVAAAQVKLPGAVFLDQAHIGTVCTRVQFAADSCPPGSIYGKAKATTPLLDQPLSGSVYLRSNPSHELPDLVAKLRGPDSQPIEIDLAGKTDAVKAALRNTFEAVPDAPVSRFRLELFGGKRGLVEMSDGFCSDRKANVKLTGQNGKVYDTRPVVGAKCPKAKGKGKKGHHGGGKHR